PRPRRHSRSRPEARTCTMTGEPPGPPEYNRGVTMPSTTVTVGSAEGLHARPAEIIAEAAEKYETDTEIAYADEEAAAASALLIMALGAEKGATVTVSGEDADAVAEIAALIEQDLDAE